MTHLDPETERHIENITRGGLAYDLKCVEAAAHMRQLAARLDRANEIILVTRGERDSARDRLRGSEVELLRAVTDRDDFRRERDAAQRELADLHRELRANNSEFAQLSGDLDNTKAELADLRRSYDTLRENHTELQRKFSETKSALDYALDERKSFLAAIDARNELDSRTRSELAETKAELERLREALAARDVCWHCKDNLYPEPHPHCDACPEFGDCDDADCKADGCIERNKPR